MTSTPPEKIRLVPDEFHLVNVGRLPDGTFIYHDSELNYDGGKSRDFLVTYLFDADGRLVKAVISEVGFRGEYSEAHLEDVFDKEHGKFIEDYEPCDFWVRPFTVEQFGIQFGFVCRRIDEDGDDASAEEGEDVWRVESTPSNGLSFYPPWEDGGYDT